MAPSKQAAPDGCRLYLVTPPALDPAVFRDRLAEALDAGDVAAVQLRLKDVPDAAVIRAIEMLRPVVQDRGVAFILNDRPDLARQHGCDGAHVGADDMEAARARKVLGDLQLGISCYDSRDAAMLAGESGAPGTTWRSGRSLPAAPSRPTYAPSPICWSGGRR